MKFAAEVEDEVLLEMPKRYTLRIYESRHSPLLLAVYDNHLNELPRSVRTRLQLRQSGAREVRVPGIPMFTALSEPDSNLR
jgi:hypothetical protein